MPPRKSSETSQKRKRKPMTTSLPGATHKILKNSSSSGSRIKKSLFVDKNQLITRSTVVAYYPSSLCFKISDIDGKQIKAKGLTSLLKSIFWSNYDYYASTNTKTHKHNTGLKFPNQGQQRGKKIHRDMQRYIDFVTQRVEKRPKRFHEYSRKLIVALEKWGLIPIDSEHPVADMAINVASAVDIICRNERNELVLIEVKTGMDNYIQKGNSTLQGPLSGIFNNCPLHQAFLQLIMTAEMMKQTSGLYISDDNLYVVQVHNSGCSPFVLPQKFREKRSEIYSYFRSQVFQKKNLKELQK
jgi:hypothetical protein